MECRIATSKDGYPLLIMSDDAGAVSVEVRQGPDGAYGCMNFCSRTPVREGQEPQPCQALGQCYYMDTGWRAGQLVAELWDTGEASRQAEVWAVMRQWGAGRSLREE